ncbi:aminomethyltransferase [Plasmodium brasilianum]|uniref:Aminomethyltransferase, putative n=2 Tax=Plasmodium (Plasmodium) TaxID=418103 RepID=A0A1A8W728_PLAMA|nr:aminomethyltransferase, putative [Plasmodium malariae]KAI4836354.1 aminomethyltransferase [Plasmodium brasilianum]SBS87789.1 aminomethyltransferase, putative [Plasmodium malariae]SCO93621.1 aminomethyltransferase, putative [Plasmodium malariae]
MQKGLSFFSNEICYCKIKGFSSFFVIQCNKILTWDSKKKFGTYGAVTRKRQKQRDKFYEERYKHNPNIIPKYSKIKRGSRGGWINNPLKEVTKNSGSNFMYEEKIKEEVSAEERDCINQLIKIRKEFTSGGNLRIGNYSDNNSRSSDRSSGSSSNDYCGVTDVEGIPRNVRSNDDSFSENISPSFNLFSICEGFIDKKKEIIHKIEHPEHFVNTHINYLANEYNNINSVHENDNLNSYPKAPAYLKGQHKRKKKAEKGATFNNDSRMGKMSQLSQMEGINEEDELFWNSQFPGVCINNSAYRDVTSDALDEKTNNNIQSSSNKTRNTSSATEKRYNECIENNRAKKEARENKTMPTFDTIVKHNDFNHVKENMEENTMECDMKKVHIEDIFNYANDEDDLDISCLDVFSTLNTVDRNRRLGSFFCNKNACFILYNNCIVPSKFGDGTISEYFHTRYNCSLFDKSYQLIIKLTGNDCFYICNHFISCDIIKDMKKDDVCYTCILDNKAYIIDIGYVLKGENEITLITSGYYKKGVYEFLSDYILFCKDSGLDIHIEVYNNKRVLSLQGPLATLVFNDVLEYYDWNNRDKILAYLKNVIIMNRSNKYNNILYFNREQNETEFFKIPYMSFKKFKVRKNNNLIVNNATCNPNDDGLINNYEIICIRTGDTGEDGYEFIVDNNISDIYVQLFLNHTKVKLAGAYALDILRMESGFPLYGIDIFKNTTPITASLAWTLKYKKLKERNIFGFQNLLKEYSRKSKFLRVGIISNELIFKTCKIFSYPYKEPIGHITSCTWSPVYKKRIAQGYIKREFAKNNEKILISIPTDIPQEFSKKKKYKILRSRSAHKFALAQVCALPFVDHKY